MFVLYFCSDGVLGDDAFIESIREHVKGICKANIQVITLKNLLQSVCSRYGVTEADLCSRGKCRKLARARSILAAVVVSNEGVTLQDLAHYLQPDVSTMRKSAALLLRKARSDELLAAEIQQFGVFKKAQKPSPKVTTPKLKWRGGRLRGWWQVRAQL